MARDDHDARQPEDRERSDRESEFSRRELLRAGSAVPVVLSASWLAACGSDDKSDSHGDHTDAPHNDANHTDSHTDGGSHSDSSGHTDTGHSDGGGHNDAPGGHNDAPGGHNDVPGGHNDSGGRNDSGGHSDTNDKFDNGAPPPHTDTEGRLN